MSVTGQGEAVFSHRLTPEEYDAYEAELKALRSTKGGAGATEIDLLSRLRYAPDPEQLLATHSSALAADLPVGDSMSTSLTLGGSAYANLNATGTDGAMQGTKGAPGSAPTGPLDEGDGFGVSGSASFGAQYVSQLKVEKRAGPDGERVYLTSTLTPSSQVAFEGGVTAMGVGAKFGQTGSQSASTSITVVLDPESPTYDEQFRRVSGAWAPSELERIAADPTFAVARASRSWQDATGQTASVPLNFGPVNVTLDVNEGSYKNEELSQDENGNFVYGGKGGQTSGIAGSVNGADVGSQQEDDGVKAERTADGDVNVEISDAKTGNVVAPPTTDGLAKELTPGLLASSAPAAIEKLLTDSYASVKSLQLNADDILTLVDWAQDRPAWSSAAAYTARAYLAWMDLRVALLTPDIDASIAATNAGAANQIAWCRAFVAFGAETGSAGRPIIRRLFDIKAGETPERFGKWFDWPPSLANDQAEFESVREAAERLPSRDIDAVDLMVRLDSVLAGIVACTEIEDPVDRISMIDTVTELRLEIPGRAALAYDSDYREDPMDEVDRLTALLIHYKAEEMRLLADLRTLVPAAGGDTGVVAWAVRVERKFDPLVILHSLRGLLNFWIADINRLRERYLYLPADRAPLRVSTDASDARHRDTEPNAGEYVRMRVAYASRGGDGNGEAISAMLGDLSTLMDY